MGHEEMFNLSWHTYSDHLRDSLKELKETEKFSDVTLVCDDRRYIKAHRYILSACSPVFKNMLEIDTSNVHPLIYLRGIKYSEMESIMQFIYLGEATINQGRTNDFIFVANSLKITELSKSLDSATTLSEKNNYNKHNRETTNQIQDKNEQHATDEKSNFEFDFGTVIDVSEAIFESKAENTSEIENEKMGKYKHCDKTFNSKSGLNYHISVNHKGRTFECNQCQKSYGYKQKLKEHIQSLHEGIKVTCNQCEKQFSQKKNLLHHIQAVHAGVKKYNI